MARNKGNKQTRANNAVLPVMRPDAAGIDIGATEILLPSRPTATEMSALCFGTGKAWCKMAATHVNHMQKALDQMNLQLHHVISDIAGLTGLAIVDAILAEECDPSHSPKLRHDRINASEEVIAKSLVGDYRAEHLFTLDQSVIAYRSYQKLIAARQRNPPLSGSAQAADTAAVGTRWQRSGER